MDHARVRARYGALGGPGATGGQAVPVRKRQSRQELREELT
jgi:hypothetical protein